MTNPQPTTANPANKNPTVGSTTQEPTPTELPTFTAVTTHTFIHPKN